MRTIRNLAVGLAASGACVFLGALLLGQQQGTQRLGELQRGLSRTNRFVVDALDWNGASGVHRLPWRERGCDAAGWRCERLARVR
jgi:hypothetical protein